MGCAMSSGVRLEGCFSQSLWSQLCARSMHSLYRAALNEGVHCVTFGSHSYCPSAGWPRFKPLWRKVCKFKPWWQQYLKDYYFKFSGVIREDWFLSSVAVVNMELLLKNLLTFKLFSCTKSWKCQEIQLRSRHCRELSFLTSSMQQNIESDEFSKLLISLGTNTGGRIQDHH